MEKMSMALRQTITLWFLKKRNDMINITSIVKILYSYVSKRNIHTCYTLFINSVVVHFDGL